VCEQLQGESKLQAFESKCNVLNITPTGHTLQLLHAVNFSLQHCDGCVCRGFGYVEYESMEMAHAAVTRMNNVNFRGSHLQVSWVSTGS